MTRPPSVRGMWTVHHNGVLIGAFATRAELDEWLAIPASESVIRIAKSALQIERPSR
jgi:hypothetical protein